MAFLFQKHYTVEEARALIPQLREWFTELGQLRRSLKQLDERIAQMLAGGADIGGESVHTQVRMMADLQQIIQEFEQRELQIKDAERGLVDFPAIIGGREVFLCWEKDDDDIEFWHNLNDGYAGRERL